MLSPLIITIIVAISVLPAIEIGRFVSTETFRWKRVRRQN